MARAEGSKTMSIHISKNDIIDQQIYDYYYKNKESRSRIKAILYQNMIVEIQGSKNFTNMNYGYDTSCSHSNNSNINESDKSSENHSKNNSDNHNNNYSYKSSEVESYNYSGNSSNDFDDIFGETVIVEKEEVNKDDALDIFLNSL